MLGLLSDNFSIHLCTLICVVLEVNDNPAIFFPEISVINIISVPRLPRCGISIC